MLSASCSYFGNIQELTAHIGIGDCLELPPDQRRPLTVLLGGSLKRIEIVSHTAHNGPDEAKLRRASPSAAQWRAFPPAACCGRGALCRCPRLPKGRSWLHNCLEPGECRFILDVHSEITRDENYNHHHANEVEYSI
jgi:hypothetical protein